MAEAIRKEIEVWVYWNQDGDAVASTEQDQAMTEMSENYTLETVRSIKLTVVVPLPVVPEAMVEVSDEQAQEVDVSILKE